MVPLLLYPAMPPVSDEPLVITVFFPVELTVPKLQQFVIIFSTL